MLKCGENSVATPGTVGRVTMTWSILPILESLSQARHIKWMRARLRLPTPGPSTLKRQVTEVAELSDLEFGPRLMSKAKKACLELEKAMVAPGKKGQLLRRAVEAERVAKNTMETLEV